MTTLSALPALSDKSDGTQNLSGVLSLLFEPSEILQDKLVPQLATAHQGSFESYSDLIDEAVNLMSQWDASERAAFIAGHPRIGETKNLSVLSNKEQGGSKSGVVASTPPEVLSRLQHLNACYEQRYPGLRYIIFVNGRSRAEVAEVMEDALGLDHSLSPDSPSLETISPIDRDSEEWRAELDRAIQDVGLIAKSRLRSLEGM
ncbi:hypothetical protein CONPUDRAFT_91500 [Coniophora puteana RWD-64-598 SS2]|uniref:Oxo-4-hydroxy-4-carboxy-5-ureidoimidazoline decarboxylase domain-containing protein n=1 Tax=Coniophora puteana (strain RWD-64-598) TaxID=741705 RepID=A0A5M3MJW7_CONPW|nr:uncharacterized protein CONPUDRAFT_91500 [Coniophora puteana RWD-64-598 SS2]EIW79230.1 hypothetical protein CONPUDRAFT_91500 [Coniophora puteana RWD-64-598 SS2]